MRIAFFAETYAPELNGASISVQTWKRLLESEGHQVTVVCPGLATSSDGLDILRLSSLRLLKSNPPIKLPLPQLRQVSQLLHLSPDIIHCHGGGPISMLGYALNRIWSRPAVLTYHAHLSHYRHYLPLGGRYASEGAIAQFVRVLAKLSSSVIVPSQKMSSILREYDAGMPLAVIPNPIDLVSFQPVASNYLRDRLNLGDSAPIMLFVGRLGKEKNLEFLIAAWRLVNGKLPTHLVLVGEGPERGSLEALTRAAGLGACVHFLGEVAHHLMPLVYSSADLFAFSSLSETQGLVLYEAAACGLPIVSLRDEAADVIVRDGMNGYSTPHTEGAFAHAALTVLTDSSFRARTRRTSTRLARSLLDPAVLTQRLLAAYDEVREPCLR